MVEFKVVCADPESGRSYQITVSGHHANSLVGKSVGDEIEGMFVELPGYKLQVTGGSDQDGVPMRPELQSIGRKRVLVSKSTGFRPDHPGQRRKKTFRGNTISPEVTQINMKIVERGNKPVEQLLSAAGDGAAEGGAAEAEEAGEAGEAGTKAAGEGAGEAAEAGEDAADEGGADTAADEPDDEEGGGQA